MRGRGGEGEVSRLLFVNDILVFYKPSQDQLTYLNWLLMWSEAISGLKVNLEKSELIPMGSVENVEELAQEFGYKVDTLPSSYLGLSLGAPYKFVSVWEGVKERFHKRIGLWKR